MFLPLIYLQVGRFHRVVGKLSVAEVFDTKMGGSDVLMQHFILKMKRTLLYLEEKNQKPLKRPSQVRVLTFQTNSADCRREALCTLILLPICPSSVS